MATPILVLLFCLPLLRPLRHPGQASGDEQLRLATISALVQHSADSGPLANRLAINSSLFIPSPNVMAVRGRLYSDQPPMLAFLLSGPAWVLNWMGFRLQDNSVLVPYLLTLLGVTLPVAGAAGLVYRMGRIFELPRQWRTALAAAVVFGTGLISYAVVLNAHVPAAVLVLAAAGCMVHLVASETPSRGGRWLVLAGFCAALAATIDLSASVFLLLFLVVIPVMRLPTALRVGGVLLYLIGVIPPILLHASLTVPLTGNILPGAMHPELAIHRRLRIDEPAVDASPDEPGLYAASDLADDPDANPPPPTFWQKVERGISSFAWTLLGDHGLLVHFPVVVLGIAGMFAVMHRHWPLTTKVLAADAAIAALIGILGFSMIHYGASAAAFGTPWLIVFLPFLFFWSGAWLRRPHRAPAWALAGLLLAFSIVVSLIGATDPMPAGGYSKYTAISALHDLFNSPPPVIRTAMADR
ncbi:MAG TPA: hypothetical protein VHX86_08040 [Tepidisphaeraceae bacterium]|nr:hypothetical protein [Tepidisphaeraceae bacterium]